jgi:hypothetical protein
MVDGKCDVRVGPRVVLPSFFEKKGRKSGGCVLLLLCFYEKLVQRVGLCFGLSSFSLWISALFIEVEREVWSIYLP